MRPIFLTCALCLILATSSLAVNPTISQVFVFACNSDYSSCPDGMDPTLAPVQLADGSLYGVTWWAGQGNSDAGGTVWKVTTSGVASVLHTFEPNKTGQFPKGENPVIGFVQGADGKLYGITESGGKTNQGVMFQQASPGAFKVEHNFCTGQCTDIQGRIILGKDGNFYGIQFGGTAIFRITPAGVYKVLYTLNSETDGYASTLMQGSDGNFYGTGAIGTPCDRQGTVFQFTSGGQFNILTTFEAFATVGGNLVQASDGNFYGAHEYGGTTTIFRMTPGGTVTMLYQLQAGEGSEVVSLMQASDGNLWGLTSDGGPQPARPGAVFAATTGGSHVADAAFNCSTTGCTPTGMIQGSDGNFYGIAISGGSAPGKNPMGTLFKIDAGLGH
ncbi:MAG: choice-of-anchor tandem repeat GloVer-containing protein [Terriglobales bacterium]